MAECPQSPDMSDLDDVTSGKGGNARFREFSEVPGDAALSGDDNEHTVADEDPFERAHAAMNPPAPASDNFVDESRFTRDSTGALIHKWKVDYAQKGGGGRATCKDMDCLERHDQGGLKFIEKGELRICRRVFMDKEGQPGQVMPMWYHARCIFNTFKRSRQSTRIIQSPEDLEGFDAISREDQQLLRNIIDGTDDARGSRKPGVSGSRSTPEKRSAGEMDDTPAGKRHNGDKQYKLSLRQGDRVWTFCRVRPAPSDRPGAGLDVAIKSARPELGMIREEERDGCLVVQFESDQHEKERIEKSQLKAFSKIRAWLRYPRVFEGKKQRLPVNWIKSDRPPPKLCGCVKQSWAHPCECGISCSRGRSSKVWGVSS